MTLFRMKTTRSTSSNMACKPAALRIISRDGFTMIELLVVITIMAILSILIVPASASLLASANFRSNVTVVDGILEEAYSAALARNTYVWIGFSQLSINGGGVGIVAVYSPHEDPNDFPGNVNLLTKPVFLHNINLGNISAAQISNPNRMTTSVGQITGANLGSFAAPIGGSSQTLSYVIKITPSGQISLSTSNKYAWIEIGLAPLNGNGKNAAVLQMNAFTGRVATYRS